MADISKIVLGSTTYNIKDTVARAAMTGGMHFLGVSLSEITDASNITAVITTSTSTANQYYSPGVTKPTNTTYTSGGKTYTIKNNIALTAGDVVIYGRLEFVFSTSDNCWHELGSTGSLGTLAYNNTVTVKYDKATGANFTGTNATITHKVNQGTVSASGSTSGVAVSSHSYTPKGSISGTVTNGEPDTKKVSSGVNTSKLAQTTIYPQTISAPTGEVKVSSGTVTADTTTVATANASATSVLTGLTGTKTFVTSAVKASYANETLTLAAADTSTVTASSANITGVSGTQEVLSKLTGDTTFATGLTGTTTFVKSATLSTATTGGTTVATGKVSSTGTGDSVAISSNNDIDAITSLGTPTFSGSFSGTEANIAHEVTQGTVSVTGSTSGITVDDHSYTPQGSVTITNTNTTATVDVSK